MDAQIWVYVIIAIIWFVSRALKKPEQPKDIGEQRPDRPVKYNPERPAEGPKPLMTFEELLKEITEAKAPRPPEPAPTSKTYPEYVDYDDEIPEERQDLEEVSYQRREEETRRANAVYEEAKRQAFERPSLEETMSLKNTKMEFGKFKVFEQEKQRNLLKEYTIDLQDHEGLKRAFVMSEILNRKF
jgi:hypothetical protein